MTQTVPSSDAGSAAAGQSGMRDLLIIGGGINGCGIARDATGRGLSVTLCEQGDLAQATSSSSTKLFHGGLRYLEYYEFRLVREALKEREVLLRAMPHISWPLRFVLPHHTGLRPAWFLRLGLFLYDHLGGRKILPPTRDVDLRRDAVGMPLKDQFKKGFEYSDCWVDDARLVVLNARDAANRGAEVLVRTRVVAAIREDNAWTVTLEDLDSGHIWPMRAKGLVNAGGPWVDRILKNRLDSAPPAKIRLVRGSHIVVKKQFDHDRAYIFQNADKRIIFAIPYEQDFTLIGTTDADHTGNPEEAVCSPEEADYLRRMAGEYLKTPIAPDDVVWSFSGVRPLYDDGASSATAATRDYVLHVDESPAGTAPLLSVFGGKITTFRKLAEAALGKLEPYYPQASGAWTAGAPLPGGDFPVDGLPALCAELTAALPSLPARTAHRLARAYGTDAKSVLTGVKTEADLGQHFGHGLYEREVRWLMEREWARNAEDVLWRRSKLGLWFSEAEARDLAAWMGMGQDSAPLKTAATG
ncbi:MAG: glycerol-3-phosphate dehydrogenase [Rhodospirillaceae bacterium]